MEFLVYEQKYKNYKEMFVNNDSKYDDHHHCDICEKQYPIKAEALMCCGKKKAKLIDFIKTQNFALHKKVSIKKILRNIDKLDNMFQKKEFNGKNLCGGEYYPFYNIFFQEALQKWDILLSDNDPTNEIYNLGLLSITKIYNKYKKQLKLITNEILLNLTNKGEQK